MTLSPIQKIIVYTGIGIFIAGGSVIAMEPKLSKIHKKIVSDYEHVEHLNADDFQNLDPSNTVIFDVREKKEFNVSHIDGAIQVDPGIHADEFEEKYGKLLNGKTAVFYCSVGRRSSHLAERLDPSLQSIGVEASYNLIGGLFQWHNENRSLTDTNNAPTNVIHPYNNHWGRLVQDKSAISYTPIPAASTTSPYKP